MGQAAQLKVELETGDSFVRPRNLAVHVTKSVFPPDDVAEELIT
jgi:hypothetical protein